MVIMLLFLCFKPTFYTVLCNTEAGRLQKPFLLLNRKRVNLRRGEIRKPGAGEGEEGWEEGQDDCSCKGETEEATGFGGGEEEGSVQTCPG